jgi:hypothetical protein
MNVIKRVWNKVKYAVAGVGALALSASAQAQSSLANGLEGDIGDVMDGHLNTVWLIAGGVATILIAFALVVVGVRFFRKLG